VILVTNRLTRMRSSNGVAFSSSSSSIILWGSCCLSLHGLVLQLQLNASRILLFLFIHIASSRVPLAFGISPIFLRYIEITISTQVRSACQSVSTCNPCIHVAFFSNRRTLIRHVSLLLRLNEGDANLIGSCMSHFDRVHTLLLF
jgi:hypothetical protein